MFVGMFVQDFVYANRQEWFGVNVWLIGHFGMNKHKQWQECVVLERSWLSVCWSVCNFAASFITAECNQH